MALSILPDDTRDILDIWIETTEVAKFWLKVFNDLKTCGVEDILIAVTDDLKGMPEALSAVFPETTIVHLVRNSLDYTAWDKRRELAKALSRSTRHSMLKPRSRLWMHLKQALRADNIQR